jgi:CDP-glucose 4,6-dehydratase
MITKPFRACDSVHAIVSITTDKCYENREWVWGYRETDPMGGYDPYSSSKGCAEILSASYRRSYFNPNQYGKTHQVALATARAGNVIGGGDWAIDRLIPDCVRSLTNGEAISIRSPCATRPWQHVLEPLSGYLLLAQRMTEDGVSFSEGWNFGPGDDGVMNVENVVKNVITTWGSGQYLITSDANVHEAYFLKLDAAKLVKAGVEYKWSCPESIQRSVEWYIDYYAGKDVRKIHSIRLIFLCEMKNDRRTCCFNTTQSVKMMGYSKSSHVGSGLSMSISLRYSILKHSIRHIRLKKSIT